MSKSYSTWQSDEDTHIKRWKWCFLSVLSEERAGEDLEKNHGTEWAGVGVMPSFYMHVPRQQPLKCRCRAARPRKVCQGFLAPGINPDMCWHFPPYLTCFGQLWSKDSLVLVLTIMRDRPYSDSNNRKLIFMHLRPHKSYTRAIYIFLSYSTPSNILNLILKMRSS